jgi:hypothetical protein
MTISAEPTLNRQPAIYASTTPEQLNAMPQGYVHDMSTPKDRNR